MSFVEEWEQACTEGDTSVIKSFLSLLFESNQSFFFFFTLVFVYFPLMCSNPSKSDRLETASPLQVSLMAYVLELAFDDTFVNPFQWSSFVQAYSRVLHDQDFPKRVAMVVFCNI